MSSADGSMISSEVRQAWVLVRPRAAEIGVKLVLRLVQLVPSFKAKLAFSDPDPKSLRDELTARSAPLMRCLDNVLDSTDRPSQIKHLEELALELENAKIEPEHIGALGRSLQETVRDTAADGWTTDLALAWEKDWECLQDPLEGSLISVRKSSKADSTLEQLSTLQPSVIDSVREAWSYVEVGGQHTGKILVLKLLTTCDELADVFGVRGEPDLMTSEAVMVVVDEMIAKLSFLVKRLDHPAIFIPFLQTMAEDLHQRGLLSTHLGHWEDAQIFCISRAMKGKWTNAHEESWNSMWGLVESIMRPAMRDKQPSGRGAIISQGAQLTPGEATAIHHRDMTEPLDKPVSPVQVHLSNGVMPAHNDDSIPPTPREFKPGYGPKSPVNVVPDSPTLFYAGTCKAKKFVNGDWKPAHMAGAYTKEGKLGIVIRGTLGAMRELLVYDKNKETVLLHELDCVDQDINLVPGEAAAFRLTQSGEDWKLVLKDETEQVKFAIQLALARSLPMSVSTRSVATQDLVLGDGAEVGGGDTVVLKYDGFLEGGAGRGVLGSVFESSTDKKDSTVEHRVSESEEPLSWDQGLIGMRAGGRRKIVVPASLRIGQGGRPSSDLLYYDVAISVVNKAVVGAGVFSSVGLPLRSPRTSPTEISATPRKADPFAATLGMGLSGTHTTSEASNASTATGINVSADLGTFTNGTFKAQQQPQIPLRFDGLDRDLPESSDSTSLNSPLGSRDSSVKVAGQIPSFVLDDPKLAGSLFDQLTSPRPANFGEVSNSAAAAPGQASAQKDHGTQDLFAASPEPHFELEVASALPAARPTWLGGSSTMLSTIESHVGPFSSVGSSPSAGKVAPEAPIEKSPSPAPALGSLDRSPLFLHKHDGSEEQFSVPNSTIKLRHALMEDEIEVQTAVSSTMTPKSSIAAPSISTLPFSEGGLDPTSQPIANEDFQETPKIVPAFIPTLDLAAIAPVVAAEAPEALSEPIEELQMVPESEAESEVAALQATRGTVLSAEGTIPDGKSTETDGKESLIRNGSADLRTQGSDAGCFSSDESTKPVAGMQLSSQVSMTTSSLGSSWERQPSQTSGMARMSSVNAAPSDEDVQRTSSAYSNFFTRSVNSWSSNPVGSASVSRVASDEMWSDGFGMDHAPVSREVSIMATQQEESGQVFPNVFRTSEIAPEDASSASASAVVAGNSRPPIQQRDQPQTTESPLSAAALINSIESDPESSGSVIPSKSSDGLKDQGHISTHGSEGSAFATLPPTVNKSEVKNWTPKYHSSSNRRSCAAAREKMSSSMEESDESPDNSATESSGPKLIMTKREFGSSAVQLPSGALEGPRAEASNTNRSNSLSEVTTHNSNKPRRFSTLANGSSMSMDARRRRASSVSLALSRQSLQASGGNPQFFFASTCLVMKSTGVSFELVVPPDAYSSDGLVGLVVMAYGSGPRHLLAYDRNKRPVVRAMIAQAEFIALDTEEKLAVQVADHDGSLWRLHLSSEQDQINLFTAVGLARVVNIDTDDTIIVQDSVRGQGMAIDVGDKVRVSFTLHVDDGQEFQKLGEAIHKDPSFVYVTGERRVWCGLDQGVVGMRIGGHRHISVPPSLANSGWWQGLQFPKNRWLHIEVRAVEVLEKTRISSPRHAKGMESEWDVAHDEFFKASVVEQLEAIEKMYRDNPSGIRSPPGSARHHNRRFYPDGDAQPSGTRSPTRKWSSFDWYDGEGIRSPTRSIQGGYALSHQAIASPRRASSPHGSRHDMWEELLHSADVASSGPHLLFAGTGHTLKKTDDGFQSQNLPGYADGSLGVVMISPSDGPQRVVVYAPIVQAEVKGGDNIRQFDPHDDSSFLLKDDVSGEEFKIKLKEGEKDAFARKVGLRW